ncbi:MAG: hypothetical protein ACD_37C00596G0012 [uncultured bacterium]|nr:MAG: hypothetical protein ACD_37C00596G0012 [uncultured bacterium]
MELILGGGGDENTSLESHKLFFDLLDGSKRVLYIPIAILSEKYTPEGCLSWFSNAFKNIGHLDITMLTKFEDIGTSLNEYSGIYIGGGNTFKLLWEIKNSKFVKNVSEYEGVIYGGSAGAIIFGKDISTADHADKNDVNLKDIFSLDYLSGYNIWCHYNDSDSNHIQKLLEKGQKIISIGEDSAVYSNDGKKVKSIGANVRIHIQEKYPLKLAPQEQFELVL